MGERAPYNFFNRNDLKDLSCVKSSRSLVVLINSLKGCGRCNATGLLKTGTAALTRSAGRSGFTICSSGGLPRFTSGSVCAQAPTPGAAPLPAGGSALQGPVVRTERRGWRGASWGRVHRRGAASHCEISEEKSLHG